MSDIQTSVILVETMGSANIGSVARTAAAFGLESFRLVSPRCKLDQATDMWACYGRRVLDKIEYYEDLPSALADIDVAVAMTRQDGKSRHRHYLLPHFTSEVLPGLASGSRLGLVFGNEESGLANRHIKECRFSAEIPVVASDGSLNLAHAVSVTLYEVIGRKLVEGEEAPSASSPHREKANAARLRDLYESCADTLATVEYPRHDSTLEKELVRLKTIITGSGLENWEVRTLLSMVREVKARLEA